MNHRLTNLLGTLAVLMLLPGQLIAQTRPVRSRIIAPPQRPTFAPRDPSALQTIDKSKHPYLVLPAPKRHSFANPPLYRVPGMTAKKAKSDPRGAGYAPLAWVMTSGTSWGKYNISTIPLSGASHDMTLLKENVVDNEPNGGAVIHDDTYYNISYSYYDFGGGDTYVSGWYKFLSTKDWSEVANGLFHDLTLTAACTAYDPVDKKVYGFFNNSDATALEFGYVNYESMLRTTIASEDTLLMAIAANKNGQLYGITIGGNVAQINKTTGALTIKGSTGIKPLQYTQSAAFDQKTGKLYWAAYYADSTGASKSSVFEVDPKTGATVKLFDMPDNQEVEFMYIPAPPAEDGAPDQITDLALSFTAPSLTGHVTFTIPTLTFSQEQLTGQVTYYIVCQGNVLMQGTAQPGQKVDEEVTLPEGMTKVTVYTENTIGKSVETSMEKWIGYDVPDAIPYVTMTADTATNITQVTWSPSKRGLHDEYLVPAELKYDVMRLPDSVVVAKAISDTTFTEKVPVKGIHSYSYAVTPINGDQRGAATVSNGAVLGDAFEVPYVEDFLTQDAFNLYTVLNLDNDSDYWGGPNTWKWDDPYNGWSFTNHGWATINAGDNGNDDWLITPNIRLESGFTYNIGFQVRASSNWKAKLSAALGQGDDPTTYSTVLADSTFSNDDFVWVRKQVSVPEDGKYRLGLHTDSLGFYMQIDSICVDMAQTMAAPDSVTNLKLTPEPTGKLLGTISFNAPTKSLDANSLEQITKIVVIRASDNIAIHTFKNPRPGELLQYTDTEAVNGINGYKIVPYNRGGLGTASQVSGFIGVDKPDYPKNVKIVDKYDGTADISWDNPGTVGANGYFVNTNDITYNLYSATGDTLLNHSTDMAYTVNGLPQTGDQQLVQYGVSANNRMGEGGIQATNVLLTGSPYTLPFKESFAGGVPAYSMWWFDYGNQGNGWYLSGDYTADDDGGAVYWYAKSEGGYCSMASGKIDLTGATKPMLEFSYFYNEADFKLNVFAGNGSGKEDLIKTIDYRALSGDIGWRKCFVDLTPELSKAASSKPYIVLRFEEHANTVNTMFLLDDINVRDEKPGNLAVRIKAPGRVRLGGKANVIAHVENIGSDKAENFIIRLLASGRQVGNLKGTLDSHAEKDYSFVFQPIAADPQDATLEATVDFDSDADVSDNTARKAISIFANDYPTVNSLSGEQYAKNVVLNWQAPDSAYTTTEDFEFYEPLTICKTGYLGPWTTIDGDTLPTYGLSIGYTGEFEPQSFLVFNPDVLGIDLSLNPSFEPYSGKQYLLSFSSYEKTGGGGDDPWYAPHRAQKITGTVDDTWLISPELSGKAQTLTYHLGNLFNLTSYAEVLYSTTTADTAAFKSVRLDTISDKGWHEIAAQLPDGAKFFALHITPSDKALAALDDITYQPKSLQIVGYNIYRDGELIDSVSAADTTYTDVLPDDGEHVYQVAAVYDMGESELSNKVEILVTLINARAAAGQARAYGQDRSIKVLNAGGKQVAIYSVSGAKVFSGVAADQLTVPVQPGQYIVSIGGHVFNLLVK